MGGLNIPFKTTGEYIELSAKSGIFKQTTGYDRNRVFLVDEILQAVEDWNINDASDSGVHLRE